MRTSVGALNTLLNQLNTVVNEGGVSIPTGDYDLVVTGTCNFLGFSYQFNFGPQDVAAPNGAIEEAFVNAIASSDQVLGVTITSFTIM